VATYQLGSHGDEVGRIQQALKDRELYRGPIDGGYGGATQAAVAAFQGANHLPADGKVGPQTWAALFGDLHAMPRPALVDADLARRCLALTGAFETGTGFPDCFCGVSGDFDGQGLSFGVLQWNFGQGSLQPLLGDLLRDHPDTAQAVFGPQCDALAKALAASRDELMAFVRSVQHPVTHAVFEPWRGYARALGRTPEFQAIEVTHARAAFDGALRMCAEFGVWSERAVALMFDIVTQNGSIAAVTRSQILADVSALPPTLADEAREVKTLEIVANRRAQAANPRWVDDVRARKLCIARGEGTVHNIAYDLAEQFGIRLVRYAEAR
jgi:hypothetical protein